MESIKVNERFTVGEQPTKEELEKLSKEGFKSVVNLRQANESDLPITPEEEAKIAQENGLQYAHIACNAQAMDQGSVDKVLENLDNLPKPIYVHCRKGMRAGACVMSKLAIENGISGEGALMFAERMGFKVDIPELKEFTKNYINSKIKK